MACCPSKGKHLLASAGGHPLGLEVRSSNHPKGRDTPLSQPRRSTATRLLPAMGGDTRNRRGVGRPLVHGCGHPLANLQVLRVKGNHSKSLQWLSPTARRTVVSHPPCWRQSSRFNLGSSGLMLQPLHIRACQPHLPGGSFTALLFSCCQSPRCKVQAPFVLCRRVPPLGLGSGHLAHPTGRDTPLL